MHANEKLDAITVCFDHHAVEEVEHSGIVRSNTIWFNGWEACNCCALFNVLDIFGKRCDKLTFVVAVD
jgi:hypothetical protein